MKQYVYEEGNTKVGMGISITFSELLTTVLSYYLSIQLCIPHFLVLSRVK